MPREEKVRTGYEIYEGNLKEHEAKIKNGAPIEIEVRDLKDFNRKMVKAIISREQNAISGGDDLWFKDLEDRLVLTPGSIKVLEEIEPED